MYRMDGRPRGVDMCPCSSYKTAVRRTWTFVCQLQTAAVRQGKTSVYELQPLGLHNKLTIISDLAICTKMLKNVINFWLFCELIF